MEVNMKQFLNTLIWASSIGVILGAYITQIPALVTIATALYWIVSILLPIFLLLLAICFLVAPEQAKQGFKQAQEKTSNLEFATGIIKNFTLLGTYAVVGWAFPFAMTMIVVVLIISVRFSNTQVG